ncbi:Protein of unknown function [Pyronema omphalodes CBS 100304]|uniref:Uncharacterized protein n=1 Tax=Pyronema omphalodes (strain CBS 100304) TaxID=1076935 RepID=U4LLL7_PYROM|nr:Protein of unknown function [Pyronema omphalodes CBS 100304]
MYPVYEMIDVTKKRYFAFILNTGVVGPDKAGRVWRIR